MCIQIRCSLANNYKSFYKIYSQKSNSHRKHHFDCKSYTLKVQFEIHCRLLLNIDYLDTSSCQSYNDTCPFL